MSWSDYMWGRVAHDLFWIGLVLALIVAVIIILFAVSYIMMAIDWIKILWKKMTTSNVSKNNLLVRSRFAVQLDLDDKKEKKYSN